MPASISSVTTVRFGNFQVNIRSGELYRDGTKVKLQELPFKVLRMLLEQPGELVTREELRQKVWPNDTFVDFDHSISVAIAKIREALEDSSDEPRFVETLPGRGYRFLAPVEEVVPTHISGTKPAVSADQSPSPSPRPELSTQVAGARKRRRFLWGGVAVIAALGFCFGAGYLLGKRKAPTVSRPSFTRLTYERGIVYSARFAPDGHVVFDASWDNRPIRIFTTTARLLQTMPLDLASAHLLGVSATGELALALNGYPESYPVFLRGTLARAPMASGAPREILEDVRWADWDRNGELAVVHHLNGRSRLEYPVGKVRYENAGWISHMRVSSQNDHIAFVDHPIWYEDRASIVVVDLKSQERKTLSTGWESAQGLAWSATGDEVWFTAAKSGERRDLYAVDLKGRQRRLLQIPGGITLHDISRDGRVLLTVDNERIGTTVISPAGERDLSWLDITIPLAISPDGKQLLLDEQSDRTGPDYWVGLRSIDGSPSVRLGEGWGGGFSPDGKWTATDVNSRPESTFLLPLGAGERRELRHPGIKTYAYSVWFMPDGKSVVFSGIESGHAPRSYIESLQGGPARPVTPEGVLGRLPSPDGRFLVALQPDGPRVVYDIQRGESHDIPGTTSQLWPAGWSSDSRYLYMYTRSGPPSQIWRLEIATGQEKLVKQLSPTDPAGVLEILNVQMTPDAKTFVYAYDRYLSELYIVSGLH